MIKSSALTMGVVMVAVSAGTYYGLEQLPPGLIPPPIGRAHAEEPSAAAPAPTVVAAAPAIAPVQPAEPAADVASAEVTEQDLAEEPAPEPAAAAPSPEPKAETPAVAPASAPAPAPAPAQAEAPAPVETAKAESATPAPAPARAAADADVIKPWWPDPAKLPANQLKLQYAGQVQGQQAIALLFTTAPKLETLKQHASVKAANGETVAAEWSLGKNPKLAVLSGLAPGRYTVILQPQVADEKGFMLGATLTGPVYVKQP